MAGTLYGFPFDEELFDYNWKNEPDPVKTALLDSGAMQLNGEIASQISQGSNFYTVPFYKLIGENEVNYDGKTDITAIETEGATQSGIVFGRAAAWKARDFVVDFNSGADPMTQIQSQVARRIAKTRQSRLVKILDGVAASTQGTYATQLATHTTDISAADSGTVAASNKLGATTIGDAVVKACGDNASGLFNLAVMHSAVANNLAGLDLLEYRKYTDVNGIQRQLNIADINGLTVIIDDGVPYKDGKYTTYVLGNGSIQYAAAPVKVPVELYRDPFTNGGQDTLIVRYRETILPNGFSWTKKTDDGPSPTDDDLADATRYTAVYDPKAIGIVKVVSNG